MSPRSDASSAPTSSSTSASSTTDPRKPSKRSQEAVADATTAPSAPVGATTADSLAAPGASSSVAAAPAEGVAATAAAPPSSDVAPSSAAAAVPDSKAAQPTSAGEDKGTLRTAHWELEPVGQPGVYIARRIGVAKPGAGRSPDADQARLAAYLAAGASSSTSSSSGLPPTPTPSASKSTVSAPWNPQVSLAQGPHESEVEARVVEEPGLRPENRPASAPGAPAPSIANLPPPSDGQGPDPLGVLRQVQSNIGSVVIGYEGVVRALLVALIAQGHILLEGVPGLAKTYLVRAFARSLDLSFRRIQFTPDMLPADILGTVVLDPRTQMFEFRPGPIFAHVILADEINRAPPKVQSALLEAMQERQVTIEGVSYPLPNPFVVIATENPVELEGTYPLPEAELDRFLFRILLGYPSAENELRLLKQRTVQSDPEVGAGLLGGPALQALREKSQGVYVHEDLLRYLAAILRETRNDPRVLSGASPRAGVQLLMATKAAALFSGRRYAVPDDVKDLAFDVLNHRLVVRPEVLATQISSGGKDDGTRALQDVVFGILNRVAVPW